jgi:hypothetical protein
VICCVSAKYVRELRVERAKVPALIALESSTEVQNLPNPKYPIILFFVLPFEFFPEGKNNYTPRIEL